MNNNKKSKKKNNKKRKLRKGKDIAGWKLVKRLGEGGNGEVWEVSKNGSANKAMKLLKWINGNVYDRFKAEIHVLSNVTIDGIINLEACNVPENPFKSIPWYIMPICTKFKEYRKGKSWLEITNDFIVLAETLNKLHSQNISHRDIKPANILYYQGRLCFSDFGLVRYPNKKDITIEEGRDVGAKYTMAPEMRRDAGNADGIPADVYSYAKTLWIVLTGVEKGFDGQYNSSSSLSLDNYLTGVYTTPLDNLLYDCTDNEPANRPNIADFISRIKEWVTYNQNFHKRNQQEWLEIQGKIFPNGMPTRATWEDQESICSILNIISQSESLNHMFYPTGGGNTVTGASIAPEGGFIRILDGQSQSLILKPLKLTYESFGFDPYWNYFRLEASEDVTLTGIKDSLVDNDTFEILVEIRPGEYIDYYHWESREYNGASLPSTARLVKRYLKGSFVFFSTRSIYNRLSDTYDGRHNKLTEDKFREYIASGAKNLIEKDGKILNRKDV